MRTIILTIRPHWLHEIRGGEKTEEIRKTIPNTVPIRVLCCASGSGGKILCEFILDSYRVDTLSGIRSKNPGIRKSDCIGQSRVTWDALQTYMGDKDTQPIYFWHVSDLIDYCHTADHRVRNVSDYGLRRAPQSWQYVD